MGTSFQPEEKEYWKKKQVEAIAQFSIAGPWTYLGKRVLSTGKGLMSVYVYRCGDYLFALDCVVQCLWNVGTISNDDGNITWHFSHILENVEHHVKTMCESCDGLFREGVFKASCAEWMRWDQV
jgi:hypothetical protein